jgi:hypothetical protein
MTEKTECDYRESCNPENCFIGQKRWDTMWNWVKINKQIDERSF